MRRSFRIFTVFISALLALATLATADTITIGISDGVIISRDEFDLGPGLGASYVANFGTGEPIVTVDRTVGNEVAIGRGSGNISARNIDAMNGADNTSAILGGSHAITSAAVRPDGHVAFGTLAGAVYMQNRTNYGAAAPGYTGGNNGVPIFGTAIKGIGTLSNGDLALGGANGQVFVRDKNDVAAISSLLAPGGEGLMNFGVTLNDLIVTPNGNIVIALSTGELIARDPASPGVNVSSVNFGVADQPTVLAAFPNGDVVVGTSNGGVSVRNEFNLPGDFTSAILTAPGVDITALAVTSFGNVAIGTADGQVFVQDGSNLLSGISSSISFGGSVTINDLAAIPEPVSVLLVLFGGGMLGIARRVRRSA